MLRAMASAAQRAANSKKSGMNFAFLECPQSGLSNHLGSAQIGPKLVGKRARLVRCHPRPIARTKHAKAVGNHFTHHPIHDGSIRAMSTLLESPS
jgi:hypothetical protein